MDKELIYKLEQTILGSLLYKPKSFTEAISYGLDEVYFSSSRNRLLFSLLNEMYKNNEEITLISVSPPQ